MAKYYEYITKIQAISGADVFILKQDDAGSPTSVSATIQDVVDDVVQPLIDAVTITNINDIGDVTITTPANGEALVYNAGTWENAVVASTIDSLTDVTLTTPANGEALIYNGSVWINAPIASTVDSLTDVTITTPANGEALVYNAGTWENAVVASTIDSLTDVTITTPANGEALVYNAGTWENAVVASTVSSLSDTNINTPITGQVLTYSAGVWINTTNSSFDPANIGESLIPTSNAYDLGSTSFPWGEINAVNWLNFGGTVGGVYIKWGNNLPEGSITASPGSLYMRTDGTSWRKETGTGNTGWVNMASVDLTSFDTDIIPDTNSTYDIGEFTTPLQVRDIYYSGVIYKGGTELTPVVASATAPTDTSVFWIDTSV